MQQLRLFHFSGTGNSYRAATWLALEAETLGLEAHVEPMSAPAARAAPAGARLGLTFPTHGFTAPWHVIRFACRLPRGKSAPAFCVAARAGLKFGPVCPPGVAGTAALLVACILACKGYKVMGVMSVDMPSNWFSLHPIQRGKAHAALLRRAQAKVSRFARRVLGGERAWISANNLYELLWALVLWPVSALYLLAGRFFLAKLFFANQRCTGCGLCARQCPTGSIHMRGTPPRPFWSMTCESCMRCAGFCPENAVEAGHSWAVILYCIATVPVGAMVLSGMAEMAGLESLPGLAEGSALGWMVRRALYLGWLYLSLFLSYRLFAVLIRIPCINRLFTLTTLTHLPSWGRYHEPETAAEDLTPKT